MADIRISQVPDVPDGLATSHLSDALDLLGLRGCCRGIHRLAGSRMVGQAFTARYVPAGVDTPHVGDFLDDVPPGAVVVIDNAGRTDCTVWGELMSTAAVGRGIAGTVIDGVCRDVDGTRDVAHPMFAKGVWMRSGKGRVQLAGVGAPVTVGGVLVSPGDVLVGDGDGVVSIPASRADEVVEAADRVRAAEARIQEMVQAGGSLRDARRAAGYHDISARPAGGEAVR